MGPRKAGGQGAFPLTQFAESIYRIWRWWLVGLSWFECQFVKVGSEAASKLKYLYRFDLIHARLMRLCLERAATLWWDLMTFQNETAGQAQSTPWLKMLDKQTRGWAYYSGMRTRTMYYYYHGNRYISQKRCTTAIKSVSFLNTKLATSRVQTTTKAKRKKLK